MSSYYTPKPTLLRFRYLNSRETRFIGNWHPAPARTRPAHSPNRFRGCITFPRSVSYPVKKRWGMVTGRGKVIHPSHTLLRTATPLKFWADFTCTVSVNRDTRLELPVNSLVLFNLNNGGCLKPILSRCREHKPQSCHLHHSLYYAKNADRWLATKLCPD